MTCHTPTPSVVVPDMCVPLLLCDATVVRMRLVLASSCTVTITKQTLGLDELEAAMETAVMVAHVGQVEKRNMSCWWEGFWSCDALLS